MTANDELLGVAEIAVALIGFSGLIFVFRSRDATELEARDLSAIAIIMSSGALALLFALLPLPISHLGLVEAVFWRLASGVFGAGVFAAVVAFVGINRRLVRSGHAERTPRLNRLTMVAALATAALLLLAALGVVPAGPAVYLFGLIVCIVLCLAFIAFALVVARRSPAS